MNKKLFDPTDLSCERWNASSDEDRKRIDWHRDWNGLKDVEREFLLLIYPELLELDKLKVKRIQRLLNSAMSRAIEKGFIEKSTCSRCNGDGHYSWNRVDGSVCYGCHGTGITRPRVTKKLIKIIKIKKKPECFGDFNTVIHSCFKNNCELVESCRRQLHKNYVKAVKEFKNKKITGGN